MDRLGETVRASPLRAQRPVILDLRDDEEQEGHPESAIAMGDAETKASHASSPLNSIICPMLISNCCPSTRPMTRGGRGNSMRRMK
ncbi:MAG: hypothetical protein ACLR0N_14835 [Bilophila wadsworthia]